MTHKFKFGDKVRHQYDPELTGVVMKQRWLVTVFILDMTACIFLLLGTNANKKIL